LPYLVKRVELAERARMVELLRPLGVTLHQYTAMSILERREGLSSAQLARRHVVSPQAMHQLIASMERDRLVERRPDAANRRILRIWLTEHGAEVLRDSHTAVDVVEERMLSTLTDEEAATFARAVEHCLAALSYGATGDADDTMRDAS
jgi:DNA-binding MarR family transcriptional regulator